MRKPLIGLFLIITLTQCKPTKYYQVFTTSSKDLQEQDSYLRYENEDIIILYNFWSISGDGGFEIFNKTEGNLFIDLTRTHLIKNDMAFTYSNSLSGAQSNSKFQEISNDPGSSDFNEVVITEVAHRKLVCIPPKSAKSFMGFHLFTSLIVDCELPRYPKKEEASKMSFTLNNSPMVYRHYLTYLLETNDNKPENKVDINFWISEVQNLRSQDFAYYSYLKDCDGKDTYNSVRVVKVSGPSKFYIDYSLNR